MNRFIIYLPDDRDWVKVLTSLQKLGSLETDRSHMVTLVSPFDTDHIDAKLKEGRKSYVLVKVEGELRYNVRDHAATAVLAIHVEV